MNILFWWVRIILTLFYTFLIYSTYAQTGPGGVSSNLTLWFKANAGTTTSGSNLTGWADQSGNSFNITQGAANNQPTLGINAINFNPALQFDGSNDYLPISTKSYTGTSALPALTSFVVFKTDFIGGAYNDNWSFLDFDRSDFFNMYIRGDNGRMSFSYRAGGTTYDNDGGTPGLNDGVPHLGAVSYNNAITNETSIRVDGISDFSANRVGTGVSIGQGSTRFGFIGDGSEANTENGSRNNLYYDGSIAEVIHFQRSLSATELSRVESYLAIKYGITLGNNTSPVSYLASDGTIVWTGSATYQNGIAGIGRDDNSFLLQNKSASSENNAVAIEAESSFASDRTFMIWGHDNTGNGITTANLPTGFERRLQKTWTVQNTGTPGTVTVDFIIANTGFNSFQLEDYNLLIDGDGDFTSGHTAIAPTALSGDTVRFTGISFSTGDFFTLAGPILRGPGGFTSGLSLWFRADAGATLNGSFVSEWKDLSAGLNHAIQSNLNAQPAYSTNQINYNPGISFDDVDDYLPISQISYTGTGSLNQVLTLVIFKTTVTGGTNDNWAFLDFDRSEYFNFSVKGNGGLRFSFTSSGTIYDLDGGTNGLNNDLPRLGIASYNNSVTADTEIRIDGRRDYLNNNLANGATLGTSLTRFGIIGDGSEADAFNSNTNNNYYGGEISEIIYFSNQTFTPTQLQTLESYLALKYGINLSKNTNNNGTQLESPNSDGIHEGDYLNSLGTVIWDASLNNGHDNELTGIGRDDISSLLQKQSHSQDDSVRVYLQTLAVDNVSNTALRTDFGSDRSFLMIGHNGSPLYDSGLEYGEWPAGVFSRIDREWLIQKTNFSGSFNLDITLDAFSDIGAVDPNDLVLMVDSDSDFTDGLIFGVSDGLTFIVNSNTLTIAGISQTMIPSGSRRFITIGSTNTATPLPIELIEFTAKAIDQYVVVSWKVASETNNDFFTVEKSSDGIHWQEVAKIDGAGDSDSETDYSLKDMNPFRGTSYYRLKQTDFDGKFEYFGPVMIHGRGATSVKIYPNPADKHIMIEMPDTEYSDFKIYDLSGNLILSNSINGHALKIDTSTLKNGIYILQVGNQRQIIRISHQ